MPYLILYSVLYNVVSLGPHSGNHNRRLSKMFRIELLPLEYMDVYQFQ